MLIRKSLVVSAFIPLVIGCSSEVNTDNQEVSIEESTAQIEPVAAPATPVEVIEPAAQPAPIVEVDYSDVAISYTEKGYPKLYATWGKKWVDDINTMMPLLIKKVAANPRCDAPSIADLSDNRSTITTF